MEENHLSLETLAKWLSGRLEHDAVLQQIVPHLVVVCPVCRERYEQIRQLQREAGHEDEEVGVVEWREAPELLRRLEELPPAERHLRVEEDESLHTWGLCQLLLQRSREAVSEDPGLALSRAELASDPRSLGPVLNTLDRIQGARSLETVSKLLESVPRSSGSVPSSFPGCRDLMLGLGDMATRIPINQRKLSEFCRRHHIRRLGFFGSVLRDDFGPNSDIDVLVEFEPGHIPGLRFFSMEEELSRILGRKVDLNTPGFLSPHFRDQVLAEAEVAYADA